MLRTATNAELQKPLREVFAELEGTSDSLVIRERGEAVAALLTGSDYERYREWLIDQAWAMIEETRTQNAHLSADEIAREVDQIVDEVRRDRRAARAAS